MAALKDEPVEGDVSYFRVAVNEDAEQPAEAAVEGDTAVSVWNATFNHAARRFVIQPPAELFPASKDSLVQLLELAEELGCDAAWVELDPAQGNFKELLRTFGYLGFVMVAPERAGQAVVMRYDLE